LVECTSQLKQKAISFAITSSILVILFWPTTLIAQSGQPIFKNLNQDFQEMEASARSLIRDSRGYLWIGGWFKLQRFDGMTVTT
jgi:ligand-binding sensor domain-containing protein